MWRPSKPRPQNRNEREKKDEKRQQMMCPGRVFVYDFSITAADVSESQGFFAVVRNSLSDTTENERVRAIGQEV